MPTKPLPHLRAAEQLAAPNPIDPFDPTKSIGVSPMQAPAPIVADQITGLTGRARVLQNLGLCGFMALIMGSLIYWQRQDNREAVASGHAATEKIAASHEAAIKMLSVELRENRNEVKHQWERNHAANAANAEKITNAIERLRYSQKMPVGPFQPDERDGDAP